MEGNRSYLPLITAWENFLSGSSGSSLAEFASWILTRERPISAPGSTDAALNHYFDKNSADNNFSYRSAEAAYLIWKLHKFVRFYTKPVLLGVGLTGQDDFAILSHIDYRKICTKKELIIENVIEIPTGIDIIKRLIKQGFIQEKVNKEDKREKLVSLTTRGKKVLYTSYQRFSEIQDVLVDMTTTDRDTLINFMKKLEDFHHENYHALISGAKMK